MQTTTQPASENKGAPPVGCADLLGVHLRNAKPCPFCGSTRIVKGERYYAMCVNCGATGPERNADATERKFVGDWNTRFEPISSDGESRQATLEGRASPRSVSDTRTLGNEGAG